MALNASTQAFLQQAQAMGIKPFHQYTPQECRALFANLGAIFGPGPEIGPVTEHVIAVAGDTVGLRIFRPIGEARGIILYLHGGGWVMGSVADCDAFGRRLAEKTGWAAALLDYRLAPEHPFPAAVEDCSAAAAWLADHAAELIGVSADQKLKIVVAGDSAGGNLATVLARRARDAGGPEIAAQVLLYPVVQANADYPSQSDPACQVLLTQVDMNWFWDLYAADPQQRLLPDASPLLTPDLSGMPPALIITAGNDPLRDEGAHYARRLSESGVSTVYRNYAEDTHGFVTIPVLTSGEEALNEIALFLSSLGG